MVKKFSRELQNVWEGNFCKYKKLVVVRTGEWLQNQPNQLFDSLEVTLHTIYTISVDHVFPRYSSTQIFCNSARKPCNECPTG